MFIIIKKINNKLNYNINNKIYQVIKKYQFCNNVIFRIKVIKIKVT